MFRPEIVVLNDVVWNGESNVEFHYNGCTVWAGAKRKDFWFPEEDWENKIKKGSALRLWAKRNAVIGFQLEENGQWVDVWCALNDFETKAEREASDKAYANFIEREGKLVADLIDNGMNYEEIDKSISDGHTGNTFGWAMSIGIHDAKDQENAKRVRVAHNKKYGVSEDKEGVVNPAILTVSCED